MQQNRRQTPRYRQAARNTRDIPRVRSAAHAAPSSTGRRRPRFPVIAIIIAVAVVLIGSAIAIGIGLGGESAPQRQEAMHSNDKPMKPAKMQAKCTPRTEEERKAASSGVNDMTPEEHVVYLTFDDGPSTNTMRILDILDEYGVKATWFVKASQPEVGYVKDIWDKGHQVAVHTWSHEYTGIYASTDAFWNDMDAAGEEIARYIGFTPTLMRFPGGSRNSYNTKVADQLISQTHDRSWHYFDWNVSSGDGGEHSADEIYGYVSEGATGNNSSCVLMHDSAAKDTTVEALPRIIEFFIEDGCTFDVLTADSFGYHF